MKRCKTCNSILKKTYYYRVPKTYCSKKCHDKGQRIGVASIDKICESCNIIFKVQKGWGKGRFCSHKCSTDFLKGKVNYIRTAEICKKISIGTSGERNWRWEGGITARNKGLRQVFMNKREYKIWRKAVLERDEWLCVQCGESDRLLLQVDHIKPFSLYPELRLAIDNGRTLCIACHRQTDTYGAKVSRGVRLKEVMKDVS